MHEIWNHMFVLGLPILEKILRPIVVYIFLIVGLRLSGKRELAQLNPFDLVVLLTLSNTVQNAIIGDDNTVIGGIIGLPCWPSTISSCASCMGIASWNKLWKAVRTSWSRMAK